ncbi:MULTISPECIES: aspartyl-phosphate phosphatase Spo0E family protein [Paenibacillus]|jgi:hypothetical protein|uniref:Sporulation protein Spo0E n=2 Tax=Paenibacillus TaxID=44249 RepID=A0A1B2DZQ9_9BACL|nr:MULTISPECIES: aspartyl-phosphate phosphatase Spo0E family protein [Paenibacillus]ANY73205.1 sporulation protein Spo0E [Paenibacillus ihbetae]MBP1891759.1 hypothetical protein [Paenibacillus lactis]MCM3494218.1 aspartyl-phosphate phosphatase Spo0E family protein [Paenibacillus lactis]GIO89000.1 hypothetical protein J31TS3_02270 [Paenibacillus lactis]HAF99208.1 aspartyl-phosphate phosphatase Spo0E family protein [Paenibacillus lactis]
MKTKDGMKFDIERERNKLHKMKQRYRDFNHPKVLEQSAVLDELINQYNRFLREDKPIA